jgi:hypothetical protein
LDPRHLSDQEKLLLVAEPTTLWHQHRPSVRRQAEEKRQQDLGRRRSVTASRVLPIFPHRRLDLGSLIKKTRASTAVSEAFAEAANPQILAVRIKSLS